MKNEMLSEKELTERLIGEDFGKIVKGEPTHYLSVVSGKTYSYADYANHGYGGAKHGYMDLPKDEYPYRVIYEKI